MFIPPTNKKIPPWIIRGLTAPLKKEQKPKNIKELKTDVFVKQKGNKNETN